MIAIITKEELRGLLPHTGEMCLLDTVEEWTLDHIRCTTFAHRNAHHPLRRQEQLWALHLVECAAQAMAVHDALVARASDRKQKAIAQSGVLGALRDVRLYASRLDTLAGPITVVAHRRLATSDGLICDFATRHDERPLCEGRIIVSLGPIAE